MQLKTKVQNGHVNFLRVDAGETLSIEFFHSTFGAEEGDYKVEFTVTTKVLPGGIMGVKVHLPRDRAYKIPDEGHAASFFVCDLDDYGKLAVGQIDEIKVALGIEPLD